MGSYSELRNKGIGTSPGTLVWVRRRNGSWWPGLVLSPDGLPRKRKRKGMPVKLLGKDDGSTSMDWYDLEKSKRIKAFRCGEYEECIKKAKASAKRSKKTNKIGKYAHREDAIIHALEIEKIQNGNRDREFYPGAIQSTSAMDELETYRESDIGEKLSKAKDEITEFLQPVISPEHNKSTTVNKLQTVKKRKWRTLNDTWEDGIKDVTHEVGLQDPELGVEPTGDPGILKGEEYHEQDHVINLSVVDTLSNNNFSWKKLANHMEDFGSPKSGRKETLNEVSKRKNRRRPLIKVLESTSRVILPSIYSQECCSVPPATFFLGVAHNKPVTLDSSESKKTEFSVVMNNSSEYSENSFDDVSGAHEVTDGAVVDQTCFTFSNELSNAFADVADGYFDDLFDVPILLEEKYIGGREPSPTEASVHSTKIDGRATCVDHIIQKGNKRVSKWHVKGKRNSIRGGASAGFCKGAVGPTIASQSLPETNVMETISRLDDKIDDFSLNKFLEFDNGVQLLRCDLGSSKINKPLRKIPEISDEACTSAVHNCEAKLLFNCSNMAFANDTYNNHRGNKMHTDLLPSQISAESIASEKALNQILGLGDGLCAPDVLYDVKVDVHATYKRGHAPLISLTSKANGKVIVGHPITVQIVDSAYSDALILSGSNGINNQSGIARCKRAMKIVDVPQYCNEPCITRQKQYPIKCNAKSHRKKKRKHSNHLRSSSAPKKKCSPISKTKSFPRKIRKLSSINSWIPVDQRTKRLTREGVTEKMGAVAACIPVKLVFSRIAEALGCLTNQDDYA